MINETTNKTKNKLTSPKGKGKFRNLLSSKRSIVKNKALIEIYCREQGYQLSRHSNYVSENKINEVYWMNTNLNFINQNWDIILDYANEHCFKILRIPAHSFKVEDFVIKTQSRKFSLEINKYNFIEQLSGIDFSPYLTAVVKY